jgi:hypothetical protein
MMKRGLGIALMLLPLGLAAQQTAGGQSESFALLNKAAGARALALGGAYEALAEGAEGMLWNPAAPALSKGLEAGLNHENLVVSTSREVLSLQAPVLSWLSLGGFGAMVSYPGVELRDNSGAYQGTYSPREQGFGLVLAAHYQGLALIGPAVVAQLHPGIADHGAKAAQAQPRQHGRLKAEHLARRAHHQVLMVEAGLQALGQGGRSRVPQHALGALGQGLIGPAQGQGARAGGLVEQGKALALAARRLLGGQAQRQEHESDAQAALHHGTTTKVEGLSTFTLPSSKVSLAE